MAKRKEFIRKMEWDIRHCKSGPMKKADLLLILLAAALIIGMILTAIYGKGKTRHGYGQAPKQRYPSANGHAIQSPML